eukprot:997796-Rhodomonas_salina.4
MQRVSFPDTLMLDSLRCCIRFGGNGSFVAGTWMLVSVGTHVMQAGSQVKRLGSRGVPEHAAAVEPTPPRYCSAAYSRSVLSILNDPCLVCRSVSNTTPDTRGP